MTQQFKAEDMSCYQYFDDEDDLYEIPPYQRPYSWEKEHITQLMDDFIDSFDESRNSEASKESGSSTGGSDSSYYLGSVIVVGDNDSRNSRFEILDGQQRITTLTILYAVLDHHYNVAPTDYRGDSVSFRLKDIKSGEWRLNTRHNADFRQTVLEGLNLDSDNRYAESASIIHDQLEEAFDKQSDELAAFADYVDEQVHMIRIETNEVQRAIRIFQTINTRGKDLSLTDKVKSYLLSYVIEDEKDDFVEVWHEIVNKLDGNYSKFDDILGWYRFYLTESEVDIGAYEDLISEIDESDPIREIRSIRDFVDAYLKNQSEADKWSYMLKNHGQGRYWQTILIAAQSHGIEQIPKLKQYLVQLYYSYLIGGHYRSKTKSPSRDILRIVKGTSNIDSVKEYIDDERSSLRIASKVADGLNSENVYDENWHKSLLIAIEYQLSTDRKVEEIQKGAGLHIEHILPKKWSSDSIDHNYWKDRFSPDQAEDLKHSLGNLIPLQYNLNESAGQQPFPEKVEIYKGNRNYPKSSFDLVDKIISSEYDKWTSDEISKYRDYLIRETAKLLDLPSEELIPE